MIKNLLSELNFSEKETQIYLALLEVGSAKAQDIAKKTRLNRTTVYDIFEVLMQKGLVSKYKKGGSTFFNALEPKHLLTYLEREKEEQAKKIEKQKQKVSALLPELISMQNIFGASKPKVQFFEGEKGMREAYEDTLTSKEIILAYANAETMHATLPNFFPEYYKRRAGNKIFIKAIIPRNKLSMERVPFNQEEMRDTRFLPDEKMTFSPEVNIYNNKILIASWNEQMAILIESKELADLQKLTFNLLWDTLPRN
ncbi:MAG: Transcriptional regulator, TrmB [Candidatus Moranbacteria bacterium GW2011_GWE1_36_7]|nr:MAG: Transcriptional regulator, TrmB [Candidatus Moranbacteria bacterium GW2011_GWD2_36_12]KKQ11807.1 MAG: Transcriptional regulator, TrmB [Candidatus Moranbacteria bacterium GW2011_GWE1_36_7]